MTKKAKKKRRLCRCGVKIGDGEIECFGCYKAREKKDKGGTINWEWDLDGTLR